MPLDIHKGQDPPATEENVVKADQEAAVHWEEMRRIEALQRLMLTNDWAKFTQVIADEVKRSNLSLQNIDPFENPKEIFMLQVRIKSLGWLLKEPQRVARKGALKRVQDKLKLSLSKATRLREKLQTS